MKGAHETSKEEENSILTPLAGVVRFNIANVVVGFDNGEHLTLKMSMRVQSKIQRPRGWGIGACSIFMNSFEVRRPNRFSFSQVLTQVVKGETWIHRKARHDPSSRTRWRAQVFWGAGETGVARCKVGHVCLGTGEARRRAHPGQTEGDG